MAEQLHGPFEKFVDSKPPIPLSSEKWVEHCNKCITCQGRYFKKGIDTAPPQSSDSE
jgi:hypothetical protein